MTRCVIAVVAALVLSVSAGGSRAQNQTHAHTVAGPGVIDGAVHPDLIPDAVAYRLYLFTVSTGQNPTETEQSRQRAHLMKIGLDDIDQQMLVSVLVAFRARYDALVAEYN